MSFESTIPRSDKTESTGKPGQDVFPALSHELGPCTIFLALMHLPMHEIAALHPMQTKTQHRQDDSDSGARNHQRIDNAKPDQPPTHQHEQLKRIPHQIRHPAPTPAKPIAPQSSMQLHVNHDGWLPSQLSIRFATPLPQTRPIARPYHKRTFEYRIRNDTYYPAAPPLSDKLSNCTCHILPYMDAASSGQSTSHRIGAVTNGNPTIGTDGI